MMNFDYLTECSGHNLYSIDIVKQMIEMYNRYQDPVYGFREDVFDPLSDYIAKTKKDPVLRFVDYILRDDSKSSIFGENDDITGIITYIVSKFYSLKGTEKVITSIENYLGLGVESYSYKNSILEISLRTEDIAPWLSDEVLFNSYFIDFIEALLFVNHDKLEDSFDIGDEGVTLTIESNVSMSLDCSLKLFKFRKIVYEDNGS